MNSMKLRQEFHNVLEQSTIPSLTNTQEKVQIYRTWDPYSNSAVIKALYRYRNYSTLSIEAFYYDQMWFSTASKMNDGFDTRISYDKNAFENAIDSEFSNDSLFHFFSRIFATENQYKALFQSFITEADLQNQSVFLNNALVSAIVSLRESIKHNKYGVMEYLMTSMQPYIKIACLSENICSPDMWGHYASSEEGFALQYDCSQIYSTKDNPNDIYPRLCTIYPVIYQSKRYNIPVSFLMYMFKNKIYSEFFHLFCQANPNAKIFSEALASFMSVINPCPDETMFTKVALHKSKEWQVEKEWRILCSCKDPVFIQADHAPVIKKTTAVFLGRRMNSNSRKLIIDIAKSKNLPIFEMVINDASSRYKLMPIKLKY